MVSKLRKCLEDIKAISNEYGVGIRIYSNGDDRYGIMIDSADKKQTVDWFDDRYQVWMKYPEVEIISDESVDKWLEEQKGVNNDNINAAETA